MVLPLINDYKRDFIWRQVVETFFGGARFRVAATSADVPCCFYVYQLLLFLSPALFGLVSTYVARYGRTSPEAAARVGAVGLAATAFGLRILASSARHCARFLRNVRLNSGKNGGMRTSAGVCRDVENDVEVVAKAAEAEVDTGSAPEVKDWRFFLYL
jgi:hypothetical protein